MIDRLTFRQWSIAVSLPNGSEILEAYRALRRTTNAVVRAVQRDMKLHGTGIMSMGEGCTPIRIDPRDFYIQPDEGEDDGR